MDAKFSNVVVFSDSQKKQESNHWIYHALAGECFANKIYLSSIDNNTICIIDKNTGNMEIQYCDVTKLLYEECLYVRSVLCGTYIFFVSNRTQSVIKFDINTCQKDLICLNNADTKLFEPIIYKKDLYLLPWDFSEQIVCIDTESNCVSYKFHPINYKILLNKGIQKREIILGNAVIVNDCIYRGSYQTSFVQRFHIESWSFEYISIKGFNRPIEWLTFDGKYFWILSFDGQLACWDEKENEIIRKIDLETETQKQGIRYAACKHINGSIYILAKNNSCILEFKLKENMLLSFNCKEILDFETKRQNDQAFSEEIRVDPEGTVYFFPFQSNGVIAKKIDNNIHFYKTQTAKRLNIRNMQQIQNESICTLSSFCNLLQKKDPQKTNTSYNGIEILKCVCEIWNKNTNC